MQCEWTTNDCKLKEILSLTSQDMQKAINNDSLKMPQR